MLPRVRAQVHGHESLTSYAVVKVVILLREQGTPMYCPTDHLVESSMWVNTLGIVRYFRFTPPAIDTIIFLSESLILTTENHNRYFVTVKSMLDQNYDTSSYMYINC